MTSARRLFAMSLLMLVAAAPTPRAFETDWRFTLGDPKDASASDFDDSGWRKVDLPHDWSIEGDFDRDAPAGGAGGFLPTGVGWYRKHFILPPFDAGRRVFVEFDGVMANNDTYINGHHLGHRPYGYIGFRYDLTDHIRIGGENVIAVRADNSRQPASRWYAGCGIYRHVRLLLTDAVHLGYNATSITTPTIGDQSALIRVQTTVVNDSKAPREGTVSATIHGPPHSAPDGAYAVAAEAPPQTIGPGGSADFTFDVPLPWPPRRWDIDH